jgi:hypothetical protein
MSSAHHVLGWDIFHISFLTICKLQVHDFLLYFSHKQPADCYFVAETCRCLLLLLLWSCALTGHISALIVYSRGTAEISHLTKTWSSWYIVWNFGRLGNLKYLGVVLRNEGCRIKKFRGNYFGVMPTTAS